MYNQMHTIHTHTQIYIYMYPLYLSLYDHYITPSKCLLELRLQLFGSSSLVETIRPLGPRAQMELRFTVEDVESRVYGFKG